MAHSPSRPTLPPEFRFGVATSDHQTESYVPGTDDIRDVWENQDGRTPRGRATDFWNRYPEDLQHAKSLGCRMFRISLAWSRLEPTPGVWDDAAFEHYRALIRAIHAAGMEPLVTLHHFTWPLHIEERGGLQGDRFVEYFEAYAEQVARRLGTEAKLWVTFNEPSQLVFGYIKPFWAPSYFMPPGLPKDASLGDQATAVGSLIRNLFVGHTRARERLQAVNPQAQVGANPMVLGLPTWLQSFIDWNATRVKHHDKLRVHAQRFGTSRVETWVNAQRAHLKAEQRPGWFTRWVAWLILPLLDLHAVLSTLITSNWWHLGMAGKLSEHLCPSECVGKQDYAGVDYYWGIGTLGLRKVRELMNAVNGQYAQAPVWPGGLGASLRRLHRWFPKMPVLVIENGCVENASGVTRAEYLRRHIAEVVKASRHGVNVVAYLCWSITTNRELGLPLGPNSDFGLFHIDLDTDPELKRQKTPSASLYAELIAQHTGHGAGAGELRALPEAATTREQPSSRSATGS